MIVYMAANDMKDIILSIIWRKIVEIIEFSLFIDLIVFQVINTAFSQKSSLLITQKTKNYVKAF